MKKHAIIFVITLFAFSACTNNNSNKDSESLGVNQESNSGSVNTLKDIPYVIGERYFLKNNVAEGELPSAKIETQEGFEHVFGAAATMGENGMPTKIDFDKQYVIAVAGNTTDTLTEIKPVSLQKNDQNEVVFTYAVIRGEKQSYSMKPSLLIIVDKSNDGTVVLKKQD